MNSVHLQQKLLQHLLSIGLRLSRPQMLNLAIWIQALAVSSNCHLPHLALSMPLPGRRENLVQRLRRFLKQRPLAWHRSYGPLVEHIFTHWQGQEVALVLDRTDLGRRWSILVLGAAYRKRLLPLTWRVLPFGGTSAEVQLTLLRQVAPYLPKQTRVHLYGDCEFRAVELHRYCQKKGWHWQLGVKSDTYVQIDGVWQQLQDLPLQTGERRYWQQLYLTRSHSFGPVNLIGDWSSKRDYPLYWSVDLPADAQAWRRGRKRFWIEPTFRDWKSYGFDLERCHIDAPLRLDMLLLGMSITTVWMIHIGDWLTRHGHDRLLDRTHYTDYSLFHLGRDYVIRCQTMGWSIPIGFVVKHR